MSTRLLHQAFGHENHRHEFRSPQGGDSPSDESRPDRGAVNCSNCELFQRGIVAVRNRSSRKSFQPVMPALIDVSPSVRIEFTRVPVGVATRRKARPAENGRACEFEDERCRSAIDQGMQTPHSASMKPRSAPLTVPLPLKSAVPGPPNWASRRPMSPPLTTRSPLRSAMQISPSSHSTPP